MKKTKSKGGGGHGSGKDLLRLLSSPKTPSTKVEHGKKHKTKIPTFLVAVLLLGNYRQGRPRTPCHEGVSLMLICTPEMQVGMC